MRSTIHWIAALLIPALVATGALVGAPKKGESKEIEKTTEKMARAGRITGKVMAVYEDKKMIRLSVQVPKLNAGAVNNLMQARLNMARARSPQDVFNAQNALMQAQRKLVTYEGKDLEVKALDDVVVRMARPKEEFDAKGRPRRYTKKELAEMRGEDKKLPGYKAEFSDIATEQVVEVHLVRKKGLPPVSKVPRRGRGKMKEEPVDADLLADYTPQASLIVIVAEPRPSK